MNGLSVANHVQACIQWLKLGQFNGLIRGPCATCRLNSAKNRLSSFCAILLTRKHSNADENIDTFLLAEVTDIVRANAFVILLNAFGT